MAGAVPVLASTAARCWAIHSVGKSGADSSAAANAPVAENRPNASAAIADSVRRRMDSGALAWLRHCAHLFEMRRRNFRATRLELAPRIALELFQALRH